MTSYGTDVSRCIGMNLKDGSLVCCCDNDEPSRSDDGATCAAVPDAMTVTFVMERKRRGDQYRKLRRACQFDLCCLCSIYSLSVDGITSAMSIVCLIRTLSVLYINYSHVMLDDWKASALVIHCSDAAIEDKATWVLGSRDSCRLDTHPLLPALLPYPKIGGSF